MYCTNCGHKNEEGAKFCAACGKAIGTQGVVMSQSNESVQRKTGNHKKTIGFLGGFLVVLGALAAIFLVTRKVEYDSVDAYNKFGLAKAELKGKYGYIDGEEKEVIQVKYENVGEFDEAGLVKVVDAGKTGVFDYTGKEIIPAEYNEIEIKMMNQDTGLIPVQLDNTLSFLCADFSDAFTEISDAKIEGYYIVNDGERYGCVDGEGNYLLACEYENVELESACKDKIRVTLDGESNYISLSGTLLYDSVGDVETNGWSLVKKGSKYGYITEEGEEIVPCQYSDLALGKEQSNGYAPIDMDGVHNFVDKNGKMLYEKVGPYGENGLAAACDESNNYGYIDEEGNIVIDFQFVEAGDFGSNSLARVKQDMYWGYVNKLGIFAVKPVYDEAEDFNNLGHARVKYGNVYNFISNVGVEEYEYIEEFKDDVAIAKMNGQYTIVNWDGEQLTDVWYDMIYAELDYHDMKLFKARKNGKYVLIGTDGREISEYYDGFEDYGCKNMIFWNDGKYGIINRKGEIMVDAQFNFIEADVRYHEPYTETEVYVAFDDEAINILDNSSKVVAKIKYEDYTDWSELEDIYLINTNDADNPTVLVETEDEYLIYEGDGVWDFPYEYEVAEKCFEEGHYYFVLSREDDTQAIGDLEGNLITDFNYDYIDACGKDAFIAEKNGKMGVSDYSENTIIDYSYNNIIFCAESSKLGYVWAENQNGKYGCLDREGNETIPFSYDSISETENYLSVQVNGKWGLLDKELEWIIPAEYDYLPRIDANGYCIASKDGYMGVLDAKGNVKIDFYYSFIEYNSNKAGEEFYGVIQADNYYGVINKDYEIIVQPKYNNVEIYSQYDYACKATDYENSYDLPNYESSYDLLNKEGEILISGANWISEPESNGCIVVAFYDGPYYICDINGKHRIDLNYETWSEMKCGLTKVNQAGYFGYLNSKGELAIDCVYEDAKDFSEDGLAAVFDGEYWGYINEKGDIVIPFQYTYAEDFSHGYAIVSADNGKMGVISTVGDVIVPTTYDSIYNSGIGFELNFGDEYMFVANNGFMPYL